MARGPLLQALPHGRYDIGRAPVDAWLLQQKAAAKSRGRPEHTVFLASGQVFRLGRSGLGAWGTCQDLLGRHSAGASLSAEAAALVQGCLDWLLARICRSMLLIDEKQIRFSYSRRRANKRRAEAAVGLVLGEDLAPRVVRSAQVANFEARAPNPGRVPLSARAGISISTLQVARAAIRHGRLLIGGECDHGEPAPPQVLQLEVDCRLFEWAASTVRPALDRICRHASLVVASALDEVGTRLLAGARALAAAEAGAPGKGRVLIQSHHIAEAAACDPPLRELLIDSVALAGSPLSCIAKAQRHALRSVPSRSRSMGASSHERAVPVAGLSTPPTGSERPWAERVSDPRTGCSPRESHRAFASWPLPSGMSQKALELCSVQ